MLIISAFKTSQSHDESKLVINDVSEIHLSTSKRDKNNVDLDDDVSGDKSAMERMIEDFHRNLPPPPVDSRQQKPTSGRESTIENATTTASSSKRTSKHGTLTSQISNW